MTDNVNHPQHYTSHPSGIECIQVVEHMGFNLGSAVKYLWRCDLKHDAIEDLEKAIWYIRREIEKRALEVGPEPCCCGKMPDEHDPLDLSCVYTPASECHGHGGAA